MKKHLITVILFSLMLSSSTYSTTETKVSQCVTGTGGQIQSDLVEINEEETEIDQSVENSVAESTEDNQDLVNEIDQVEENDVTDSTEDHHETVNENDIEETEISKEEIEVECEVEHKLYNSASTINSTTTLSDMEMLLQIEKDVKEACLEGKTRIIFTEDTVEDFSTLLDLEYISPYINDGYSTDSGDSNAISITFFAADTYWGIAIKNPMDTQATKAYFNKIDRTVNEILSLANARSSDLEKALVVHDYLTSHYEYDLNFNNYSASDLINDKTAVCQGYAYAYQYFMTRLGIECYLNTSDSMGHAWNVIKINGKYYQVDNTWDDSVPDCYGQAEHSYFLCSDTCFTSSRDESHYDWSLTDLVCSDTTYDNYYWTNINSPIVFVGSDQYYITSKNYLVKRASNGTETKIQNIGYWPATAGSYYVGSFSGLALYDGCLYYNSAKYIYSYNLSDGTISIFYTPDTSSGNIYGMIIEGSTLSYSIQSQPGTSSRTIYEVSLPEVTDSVVLGDINLDGNIDVLDGQMVMAYIENTITLEGDALIAADVDQDGDIDQDDVQMILDYTTGNITEF